MNSRRERRYRIASEKDTVAGITSRQPLEARVGFVMGSDAECGAQAGKMWAPLLTSSFKDLGGRWPWKQVELPFLILFSNYMKCVEKGC